MARASPARRAERRGLCRADDGGASPGRARRSPGDSGAQRRAQARGVLASSAYALCVGWASGRSRLPTRISWRCQERWSSGCKPSRRWGRLRWIWRCRCCGGWRDREPEIRRAIVEVLADIEHPAPAQRAALLSSLLRAFRRPGCHCAGPGRGAAGPALRGARDAIEPRCRACRPTSG